MPTRAPLPEEYGVIVRGAIAQARLRGQDPAERLHKARLLLVPAEERAIETAVLHRFAEELQRWQPHEMLRRKFRTEAPCTPADMYVVLQEFLTEFIEHRRIRETI
jgi:hypothetical protein